MTTFPKARRDDAHSPSWLKAARAYYGDAFEAKKKTDLAAAMADWCEMDPDERGFVLAHLQYLGLQAQLGTQKMLRELRALFEEVGDEVIEALDGVVDAVEPEAEEADDADEIDEVIDEEVEEVEDNHGDDEAEPEARVLDPGEDTPIPDYEPEPRVMPVEAVAPELLRDTGGEPAPPDLPGLDESPSEDA
jgi:hypothetical protein